MKIHIICGLFYPELHPRAFRATELAKEFVRRGHQVKVSLNKTTDGFGYDEYIAETGISIERMGVLHGAKNAGAVVTKIQNRSSLYKGYYAATEYLMGRSTLIRARKIAKRLHIDDDTDMVIAISTPFICVLGTSYYLRKHNMYSKCVMIADSGDPFYYSKQNNLAPWFKIVERSAYKQYDYLTIPVETAIPGYNKLIPEEKIRIIPQGFNMNNLNLYQGEHKKPVKFAYSGVFYMDIRNPEFLFAYLDKQEMDYEFHWYMRYDDPKFTQMLERYPNLKNKTHIRVALGRDELLYELSRMDFLLNIENTSNSQLPSKLIDYGMTGKPVFSCNKENFSEQKMQDYLNGNYHDAMEIDIEKYRIENVAQQFLDLYKEKNRDDE